MAMSQTDIDRVKTAFDAVKADMGRRLTTTLRGAVNGVAELDASRLIPTNRLGTGTAGTAMVLHGDRTWKVAQSGGSPTVANMPAGFAMMTPATTRPTSRTDIPVIFVGADPGVNMLTGDIWMGNYGSAPTASSTRHLTTLIPASPEIHGGSPDIITAFAVGNHPCNMVEFGIPIYTATESTPRHTIVPANTGAWGVNPFDGVPVPVDQAWTASFGSDGAMAIKWTDAVGMSWEAGFWQYSWNNGNPTCTWGSLTENAPSTWCTRGSSTAANFARSAGVITRADLIAGRIEHALTFSSDITRPTEYWYPALKTDGQNSRGVVAEQTLPEGARVQLNPAVSISALTGINWMVADALQRYGAYCVDNGGASAAFAFERPNSYQANGDITDAVYTAKGLTWDYYDLTGIPWAQCRVLHPSVNNF